MPQKFYEYIDESGQDTAGKLFVVTVVVLGMQRYDLEKALEAIETETGKRKKKWTDAKHKERDLYIRSIRKLDGLNGAVYFDLMKGSKDYQSFTATVAAAAVRKRTNKHDEVTIYIDGYTKSEISNFKRLIKPSMKARTFVKKIHRDESSSLIRLADSLCGLFRDAEEGSVWAKELRKSLKRKSII